jgi:hypothetical protein
VYLIYGCLSAVKVHAMDYKLSTHQLDGNATTKGLIMLLMLHC